MRSFELPPNAAVQRPRAAVDSAARVHNEMARLRRARDDVSRSAATACYAAGTTLTFLREELRETAYHDLPTQHPRLPRAGTRRPSADRLPREIGDAHRRRHIPMPRPLATALRNCSRRQRTNEARATDAVSGGSNSHHEDDDERGSVTLAELRRANTSAGFRAKDLSRSDSERERSSTLQGSRVARSCRLTPQFSGRALPCAARRVCIMK